MQPVSLCRCVALVGFWEACGGWPAGSVAANVRGLRDRRGAAGPGFGRFLATFWRGFRGLGEPGSSLAGIGRRKCQVAVLANRGREGAPGMERMSEVSDGQLRTSRICRDALQPWNCGCLAQEPEISQIFQVCGMQRRMHNKAAASSCVELC